MSKFVTSTNIIRDEHSMFDYIVTRNAIDIFSRILFNYKSGQHSFNIIGSYGTGKSTFLWALEKHLKGETVFFQERVNGQFSGFKNFEFFKFVGQPISLREAFANKFNAKSSANNDVINAIDIACKNLQKKKKVLVILIDEFGKHLEYASKKDVDEIYFVQQLAEYCNSPDKQVMLITTLHQNFGGYARGLDKTQRDEWLKVKGRLTDLTFDEPVEQLLFFASEKLTQIKLPAKDVNNWKALSKKIVESGLLGKQKLSGLENKLYPLDLLAAHTLTHSLQKYGQNDRSLFTFIESKDLKDFADKQLPFTVSDVFDYLRKNLSAELQDGEKNPHKAQWIAASKAIEKAETILTKDAKLATKLLKTIALVNIFAKEGGLLDDVVLSSYLEYLGEKSCAKLIAKLEQNKLIKFFRYRNKYNFIDGTDVDIQQELFNASKFIDHDINLTSRLKKYFTLPIIPLKKIYYKIGTPRFFEYRFIESLDDVAEPKGEVDGYINVIVTNKSKIGTEISNRFKDTIAPQVFVLYKEIDKIKTHLIELDKINFLLDKHSEDKVAVQLFNEEKHFVLKQLEIDFIDAKFNSSKVKWYWKGKIEKNISSVKSLNSRLSEICEISYPNVPIYRNELSNKEQLSTPVLTARKALIKQLLSSGNLNDIGFDENKFPPEKTIYLALLKKTRIHRVDKDGIWTFGPPSDESFTALWNICQAFLDSAKNNKRNVKDLYEKLLASNAMKLKKGFVDFWVPIFLIANKEQYALYLHSEDNYIPFLDPDVLDLLHKKPANYIIKTFNTSSVSAQLLSEYKDLTGLDNSKGIKGVETASITVFSNFIRFYRGLNQYAQSTQSISSVAIRLRDAISKSAKDPYNALFEQMPAALGYYPLEEDKAEAFRIKLEDCIREIRVSYDELLNKIENTIKLFLVVNNISFEDYKLMLNKRFKHIKTGLLSEKQRVFYNRLRSPLDDRASYLKSLADYVLGRPLDKIKDAEVEGMLDQLVEYLERLNDVVDLHASSEDGVELMQMKILGSDGELIARKNIDVNASKTVKLEKQIEALLKENDVDNIATLMKVLKKQIDNEK